MKSLFTNWIRNASDKTMPIPEVMYFRFQNAGAKYYHPQKGKEIFDMFGKPHSLERGVIALNPKSTNLEEELIAHEWRHHMQYFRGADFKGMAKNLNVFKLHSYEQALRKYFISEPLELDAVRFQYKHVSVHEIWEKVLYDLISELKSRPIISYANYQIINA